VLFAGGGVHRQLGLDRAQQPDLGDDLGGQLGERHGRMITVELDGGCGGGGSPPLTSPLGSLLLVRRGADQEGQLGGADGQQGTGVGIGFQDRQIGFAQIAGQRRHRHQLPD
jgi:hypothetical protein